MGIEKYGEKSVEALKKAGKAILTFKLVSHADDYSFKEKLLCADIYILNKDKYSVIPKDLPDEDFQGTVSSEDGFSCEVQVESIFGFFKRISEGMPKKAIKVWVVVEPAEDHQGKYTRTIYGRTFNSGREYQLKIKLAPKYNNV